MVAEFSWTNAAGGDWSEGTNWTLITGATPPPPRAGDEAHFGALANNYTVTVTGPQLVADVLVAASLTSAPTFVIDGSLATNTLNYGTAQAISTTVAAGGLLNISTTLKSSGAAETITISGIGAGGHVELTDIIVATGSSNVSFDFANAGPTTLNTGVIQFDKSFGPGNTASTVITNVARGDEFVVGDLDFTGDTVAYDPVAQDLTVKSGSKTVFTMSDVSLQSGFALAGGSFDIVNGNTIEAVVCYARGTMIRTPDGELPVEKLRPGKQVITLADGEEIPQTVIWLGHRRISLTGHPRPETVAPIRIRRDVYAHGVPHRDLVVSPDHAIFLDGKLICARQLVNGTTIRQELDWTAVDYYHVELDQHAILLAEGLPAESYIDTGNSGFFANSDAPLVLHPDLTDEADYPTREAGSCAPFVWDEASVQPVWQRLADRAAVIGRPVPQRVTTTDAALRLLSNRRTIKPVFSDSDRAIFVLPRGASEVQLLSRAQSPTEARPWLEDRRRLGVRVKRVVLRGVDDLREVPVDHPDLTRGWWGVERDGQIMSRWTDGEAVLPLPAMSGHVVLEIHLAGSMIYAVHAVPADGAERRAAA